MTRAPAMKEERYRGRLGQTRRELVPLSCPCGALHRVEVLRAVDAASDPALARRVAAGELGHRFECPRGGGGHDLERSVLYHDPQRELFVLILPERARSHELDERIAILRALADEPVELPRYVVELEVVYGAGLAERLERAAKVTTDLAELARRRAELEAAEAQLATRQATLDRQTAEVARQRVELARRAAERAAERPATDSATEPFFMSGPAAAPMAPAAAVVIPAEPAVVVQPARDDQATQIANQADLVIERWIAAREPVLKRLDGDEVRLLASVAADGLEALLGDKLGAVVQLHRLPSYPLVTLAVGPPGALVGRAGAGPSFSFVFDVGSDLDRAILAHLGKQFRFSLELYDTDYLPVRRRVVAAGLADNVRYAVSAAAEHHKRIPLAERSFARAQATFAEPGHDRLGLRAPERAELAEDDLARLGSPGEVRRAVAAARRLSQPSGEEYLILTRGLALSTWQARRKKVVERAAELGLWPGPVLAQIAVSEGMARSRKELVLKLQRHFANLVAARQHDLDEAALRENWDALKAEAAALGLMATEYASPRSEAIKSENEPSTAGTIGRITSLIDKPRGLELPRPRPAVETLSDRELVAALEHKQDRMPAAVELCRRGEPSAAPAVFGALATMTRGEAGRVLGSVVGLGHAAMSHLLRGLKAKKGFLRQGAALALAQLKDEAATEAVCDLLLVEPTEIWREVARALGEAGAAAVMPLAARIAAVDGGGRERIAWALAHVAARGARRPVEALAHSRDAVVAEVARSALELTGVAESDHLALGSDRREQTVNRAFSRRFFEAMAGPGAVQIDARVGAEAGPSATPLDEADLLESADLEEDAGDELDESDLIPP